MASTAPLRIRHKIKRNAPQTSTSTRTANRNQFFFTSTTHQQRKPTPTSRVTTVPVQFLMETGKSGVFSSLRKSPLSKCFTSSNRRPRMPCRMCMLSNSSIRLTSSNRRVRSLKPTPISTRRRRRSSRRSNTAPIRTTDRITPTCTIRCTISSRIISSRSTMCPESTST